MASFNLAEVLKNTGAQLGTGKERIEYIDITRIKPDPANFYEITGIDELCANIELIGLQQPLRVRADEANAGDYIIVSGHRRWTALSKLANEGHDEYLSAPCIVEQPASSAELQELRLIYANSDIRRLTNAEMAKQAARVEELLYKLKEQGVDFPGRMRDHVAEACKISKSKLQRLRQIQKGLAPDIAAAYFDTGVLSSGAALELSKLEVNRQRYIIDKSVDKPGIAYLYDWAVRDRAAVLERFAAQDCPAAKGEPCCNCENIYDKIFDSGYKSYSPCSYPGTCCHDCPDLASCSNSCSRMAAKKAALKAFSKEQKAQEKAAQAAAAEPKIELIRNLWSRMAEALERNGLTYSDVLEKVHKPAALPDSEARELLNNSLTAKIGEQTALPFSWGVGTSEVRTLCDFADALNCSVDHLLCRDTPQPEAQPAVWRTGMPPEDGAYLVKFDNGNYDIDYVESGEWVYFEGSLCPDIVKWREIPTDEEAAQCTS